MRRGPNERRRERAIEKLFDAEGPRALSTLGRARVSGRCQSDVQSRFDYFERALLEAVDAGEARPGDIRARARSLFAFMEGGLLVAKVRSRPEHLTDVVQLLPALASGLPAPGGR